jgi:hypothetical protein
LAGPLLSLAPEKALALESFSPFQSDLGTRLEVVVDSEGTSFGSGPMPCAHKTQAVSTAIAKLECPPNPGGVLESGRKTRHVESDTPPWILTLPIRTRQYSAQKCSAISLLMLASDVVTLRLWCALPSSGLPLAKLPREIRRGHDPHNFHLFEALNSVPRALRDIDEASRTDLALYFSHDSNPASANHVLNFVFRIVNVQWNSMSCAESLLAQCHSLRPHFGVNFHKV